MNFRTAVMMSSSLLVGMGSIALAFPDMALSDSQSNAITIFGGSKTCTIPLRPLGEIGDIPGTARHTDPFGDNKDSYTCSARIPANLVPSSVLRFSNSFPRYVCYVSGEGKFEVKELIYTPNGNARAVCDKDEDL